MVSVGLDEIEWVRRMAAGDRTALAALYDRFSVLMCSVGARILGDAREVEDVVHDVFLEAWRKAADYDPARGSVRAWMLLRLRSRCLDRLKSAHGRNVRPMDSADEPADQATLSDDFVGGDADRLRRGLLELPADQRAVLELSYFHGLSGSEIAEKLQLPLGTVKSRAAAALDKLRTALR